jgi:hypothetical protein
MIVVTCAAIIARIKPRSNDVAKKLDVAATIRKYEPVPAVFL